LKDKEHKENYLKTLRTRTLEELRYQENLLQIVYKGRESGSVFVNQKELTDTFISTMLNVPMLKLQLNEIDLELRENFGT